MARRRQKRACAPLARVGALGIAVVTAVSMPIGPVHSEACGRDDFERVVQDASTALNGLNQKNKPAMQERLRKLRDKNGWSQDVFVREAVPFVRDDTTDTFDKRSEELLNKITAMGHDGVSSQTPDCKLLGELKAAMQGLVDAQSQKWSYLFAKLDTALAK